MSFLNHLHNGAYIGASHWKDRPGIRIGCFGVECSVARKTDLGGN
jgi:hypothetical protein